jgi:hypothetical protein
VVLGLLCKLMFSEYISKRILAVSPVANHHDSWTSGPDWPNNGEIDIIEGVNRQVGDATSLHTGDSCTINNSGFTGSLQTSNCYTNAQSQTSNAGCGISSQDPTSYGDGFNVAGGGVYAMEWTSTAISIWFFSSAEVHQGVTSGKPDPSTWGDPTARFAGNCDIDSHFANHNIVCFVCTLSDNLNCFGNMLTTDFAIGFRHHFLW